MTPISLLYCAICVSYLALFTSRRWLLNPVPIFIVTQMLMFLGTLPLVSDADPVDMQHVAVLCVAMVVFIAGAMFAALGSMGGARRRAAWWAQPLSVEVDLRFRRVLIALLAFSFLIAGAYYYLIGYNVFLLAVQSLLSGSGGLTDVATLRLQSYSGDRYLAPGYVNQFKNVFIPLLTAYFGLRYISLKKRADGLLAVTALVPGIIAVLGTGQRTAFIVAALIIIVFANAALPSHSARKLNVAAVLVLPFFVFLSTMILGRTVSEIASIADVGALVQELIGRVSRDQQAGSVVGFRYVATQPVQWGREWMLDLAGILPGLPGSPLSHEIFGLIYGTTRGTAPVSVWVSIWHNFSWIGLVVLSGVLGFSYERVYQRLYSGRKSLFRLLAFSAVSVLLGVWVAGSPATLINTGLVAIVLLYLWTRRLQREVVLTVPPVRRAPRAPRSAVTPMPSSGYPYS